MGWFNKKSWQLRRKIKDLQAEMKEAERDGKFTVEQGIFFAELADMGEMTMMVFGATDTFSSQEETVIRQFFDRNGFNVETLKLDKNAASLTDVEIVPAEEFTRHVARVLKSSGYKLIDDTEKERSPNLDQKVLPLSNLVRSMSALFCDHVEHVVATTRIKMNKEGNRLLHWAPKIAEALRRKVSPEVIEIVRPAYIDGYEAFYGVLHKSKEVSPMKAATKPAGGEEVTDRIPSLAFPGQKESPLPPAQFGVGPSAQKAAKGGETFAAGGEKLRSQLAVAESISKMYKSLIGTNANRCVKNSEILLEEINRHFGATATCLMVKVPQGNGFTIQANAGQKLSWGQGGGAGFPVSSSVLSNCLTQGAAVASQMPEGGDPTSSMVVYSIEAAAAAPIMISGDAAGIIYIDRREEMKPFTTEDCEELSQFTAVFAEYSELLLGSVS